MISSRKKIPVVTLLLLTSLFQGWPLVVAAQCRMAAAAQACEMKSACCCDESDGQAALGYSKCTTGKKMVGVLSTDPSLLSAKEKNEKPFFSSCSGMVSFSSFVEGTAALAPVEFNIPTRTAHQVLSSLFLLDCVFRI